MWALNAVLQFVLIVLMVLSLYHWFRSRFWVPKYIHYMAIGAFVVGIFLAYMALSVGSFHPSTKQLVVSLICVLGFPISVYLIYGLYGGGLHSRDMHVNDSMTIDRAMDTDEAISLLRENLRPYQFWAYENLLLLSSRRKLSQLNSNSGRKYRLEVFVVPPDKICDRDCGQRFLGVVGILTDLTNYFYKPKAQASFLMTRNGEVLNDGLMADT
jgi:hypothetical protein